MQLTTYFCPKLSNNSNNYYWFEKKVFGGKTEDNSMLQSRVLERFNNATVDMRGTRGQFAANLSPRSSYHQI